MFFDVGPLELVTLAAMGFLLFGPERLAEGIRTVSGFVRTVREISDGARDEIRSELGPEFQDFDFGDLHPKTFVRRHVLDRDGLGLDEVRDALDPRRELTGAADAVREAVAGVAGVAGEPTPPRAEPTRVPLAKETRAEPGGTPPAFDPDAT
ncbi:Sec-independent protein translocase subunit TatB [Streptomyces tagetis]|uniref:Sec-independent protein translocase subunit TatB n=1 Tax=Streptomyces tagetis TaxID=2820809 RepID=A0A940XET7_9ACTN|nr:Sec-independent protein translocase subunit TatB [Streptomyces sp. RG38]MBQ0827164.1 Sec-independent protein translocase subunit TatB [Streptomyces sp. RG38]